MKDLTHYFQSPNKASDSSNVFSEDDVESPNTALSSPKNTKPHNRQVSDSKKKNKVTEKKPRDSRAENDCKVEIENRNSPKYQVNGTSPKTSRKVSLGAGEKSKRKRVKDESLNSPEDVKITKKHKSAIVKTVMKAGCSDKKLSSPDIANGGSSNAFAVLMSTQQIFSSAQYTDKGKLDLITDENASDGEKKETKQKRKQNLEKMAERKIKGAISVNSPKKSISSKKTTKKRSRIIVPQSDSEVEGEIGEVSVDKGQKVYVPLEIIKTSKKRSKLRVGTRGVTAKDTKHVESENCGFKLNDLKSEVNKEQEESTRTESNSLKEVNSEKTPRKTKKSEKVYESISENSVSKEKEVSTSMKDGEEPMTPPKNYCADSRSLDVTPEESKKRNSLFSYFNKVPAEEKNRHSDKIKVTADVHFPSASAKKITKNLTTKSKRKQKKVEEREDEIQLLDSEVIVKEQPSQKEVCITEAVVVATRKPNANASEAITETPRSERKMLSVDDSGQAAVVEVGEVEQGLCSPKIKCNDLEANNLTPSSSLRKIWKIRIRRSDTTPEDDKSPIKRPKKASPLKRRKVKLTFNKETKKTPVKNSVQRQGLIGKEQKVEAEILTMANNSNPGKRTPRKGAKNEKEKGSPSKDDMLIPVETESNDSSSNTVTEVKIKKPTNDVKEQRTVQEMFAGSKRKDNSTAREKINNSAKCEEKEINVDKDDDDINEPIVIEAKLSESVNMSCVEEKVVPQTLQQTKAIRKKTPHRSASSKKAKDRQDTVNDESSNGAITEVTRKKSNNIKRDVKEQMTVQRMFASSNRKENGVSQGTINNIVKRGEKKKSVVGDSSDDDDNNNPAVIIKTKLSETANILSKEENVVQQKLKQTKTVCKKTARKSVSVRKAENRQVETVSDESSDDSNIIIMRRKKRNCIKSVTKEQKTVQQMFERPRRNENNMAREKIRKITVAEDELSVVYDGNDEDDSNDAIVIEAKLSESASKSSLGENAAQRKIKRAKILHCETADPKKLAPLFHKKKRPDKAFLQAQKTFLQSGVPEAVKKLVDIMRIAEELEHVVFPTVSHVQQKGGGLSWNLPDALLKFDIKQPECYSFNLSGFTYDNLVDTNEKLKDKEICKPDRLPKISVFRNYLLAIKAESPHFPVFRTFKFLRNKIQPSQEKGPKGSGKRNKRRSVNTRRGQAENVPKVETPPVQWTLKYRPTTSSEILGNSSSIKKLKKWLELWIRVQENAKSEEGLSSGDEFINDRSDDEGTRNMPKNTVMLVGPPGSGKTMAVYAIARELGYKVLEVNASSKRTGRRVLSELLEATQSHQVKGSDQQQASGLKTFLAKSSAKKHENLQKKRKKTDDEQQSNSLSLILVEDADIVFEDQDDGFVSALSTLMSASKRPVVLVTSDNSCLHLTRFLEKSIVLDFSPASAKLMCVWLQLVCLLESVRVGRTSMEDVLNYYRNDMRRTLLYLQFWALSGGSNCPHSPATNPVAEIADIPDDTSNGSWISEEEKDCSNEVEHPVHSDCLSSVLEPSLSSLPLNLGALWWNLPLVLDLPVTVRRVIKSQLEEESDVEGDPKVSSGIDITSTPVESTDGPKSAANITSNTEEEVKWRNTCSKEDVSAILKLSEVLSSVDILSLRASAAADSDPVSCSWQKGTMDSLSLGEDMSSHWWGAETVLEEMCSWLVAGGVRQCVGRLQPEKISFAPLLLQRQPPVEEMSWRKEQHSTNNELWSAVPSACWFDRRSMMTDYVPSLRSISRLEQGRSIINTKRRFYHYLKSLGVHANASSLDALCSAFDLGISR